MKKIELPSLEEKLDLPIFLVKKACPICKGDVKGNTKALFFCKNCNILYRTEDLEQNT